MLRCVDTFYPLVYRVRNTVRRSFRCVSHVSHFPPRPFFIQGPRNCLGQHLALLEARVILGSLSKRFKFTSVRQTNADICPKMIPLGPAAGMWLTVE